METITKQKLLDLKYEEVGDAMRKKYPEDDRPEEEKNTQPGKEIGIVIFRKEPNSADSYIPDNKFLMLFYYKRSWDANEFLSDLLTAIVQYREDMRALGFETEGGDPALQKKEKQND